MTNRYLKVKDHSGLVRDVSTGAIINVDDVAYESYKAQKNIVKQKYEKELTQEKRINTLEQKIDSVENTLQKILDILSNGNT